MKMKTLNNFKLVSTLLLATLLASCGVETTTTSDIPPPTTEQAARILSQATFGPTVEEINRLKTIGAGAWFNDQFSKPQTKHFGYVNQAIAPPNNVNLDDSTFQQSFWKQAITGDDQLRQRVTFALSQIFVISFQNATLGSMPRSVASYYDTLGAYAFGNYRDLLKAITLHPAMGIYLSALRNQKTQGARVPDENYAREIMQLFSIGLIELNPANGYGTDTSVPTVATYTNEDIKGLAKVFTGWSWGGADKDDRRFTGTNSAFIDPFRDVMPMQNYPQWHEIIDELNPSVPNKVFLGVTIQPNTSGEASLDIALDRLFNHPNVGPFIARQLIQRLVTSNPSAAYIGRVAAAFEATSDHPRGDMKAVIKAVLLDQDALNPTITDASGKLREPVLRLANWMRAFHAKSTSGIYPITGLTNTINSLGQSPMNSPSVFNYYRPDYQPANSQTVAHQLFAPEMQITEETSVVGYLNYMRGAIPNGVGTSNVIKADYSAELELASTPSLLVERVNLLLMSNQMSQGLKDKILAAIDSNKTNSAANKVYLAIYLTMASPEYLVQK